MDTGTDLEVAEPVESSVLLGILPMFLRRKLVDERSFRQAIGFEAEELVTYGEDVVFARSLFFERVSDAFAIEGGQSEIKDHAGNKWTLSREQISSDRVALKISNAGESFFAAEFFVFLPEASERLKEFDVVLNEHGFPLTGLSEWRALLTERTLTSDELEEFSQDIMKTPIAFLRAFRGKIESGYVSAEDMVPKDIEYFENLSGKGDESTLPVLASEVVSKAIGDYLAWDDEGGPRMALLLCSHPAISKVIETSRFANQQLIGLAEWVRDHGDVFSKVGIVEATLLAGHNLPELEIVLGDIVQQIIGLNPEDKSGPLQLMTSFIALVESEVSRTRVLKYWPPFRRRLATFAHAAMLAREAQERIDTADFSAWTMENHGHRFYLQGLIDLRDEPRWLPDYASPAQLKQELLGRLFNAVGAASGSLPKGPLRDTFDLENPDSRFNRARTIKSSLPGPLEGSVSSLRNPIPQELEAVLDRSLADGKLTAKSITVLINTTGIFQVGSEKADRALEAIKESNFRFAENLGEAERFSFVHGLAEVASRLRSEDLARSVRAVARSHRDESNDDRRYNEEIIICLVAAGAFADFDAWIAFVGDWINELCFRVEAEAAGDLAYSLQTMCSIEPRLRSKLGAGVAALSSIQ
ncbi:hypothetical protein [Gymnodinialimonas sp. 57CJ19]|uniref:hypothetical protein n=1 Tax=Gymnodinialimonas sp. 57CJ19 TaxID=3138498 RepID=UPI0031344DC3